MALEIDVQKLHEELQQLRAEREQVISPCFFHSFTMCASFFLVLKNVMSNTLLVGLV
jgi:hypothetical protein